MFLSAYHFGGDPEALAAAHDRFCKRFPPASLGLHVCVLVEDGITVFDACPSREVFTAFSHSDGFRQALAEAGLPRPRLEPLGEVHEVRVPDGVAS